MQQVENALRPTIVYDSCREEFGIPGDVDKWSKNTNPHPVFAFVQKNFDTSSIRYSNGHYYLPAYVIGLFFTTVERAIKLKRFDELRSKSSLNLGAVI